MRDYGKHGGADTGSSAGVKLLTRSSRAVKTLDMGNGPDDPRRRSWVVF